MCAMRYPNQLRVLRGARGITQWQVAKVVDLSPDRYLRLEKGVSEPSLTEAMRLGAFFNVAPQELFRVEDQAQAS